jgi:hypothetical protein
MAQRETGGRFDRQPAVDADAQTATIAEARQGRDRVGRVWRPERTTPDGLIGPLPALSGRFLALETRTRGLAREVVASASNRAQAG